jgi:hypothetical protein
MTCGRRTLPGDDTPRTTYARPLEYMSLLIEGGRNVIGGLEEPETGWVNKAVWKPRRADRSASEPIDC